MTIDTSLMLFPANVVELVATRAQLLDADLFVCQRPLRQSDPNQSVGVTAAQWLPQEESYEMRGGPTGRHEPTLQSYLITVQAFIKDMDRERGLAVHTILSKMLRSMLYRDEPLRVGLAALEASYLGSTERTQRWGIRQQRFFGNDINSEWLYLSNLEFWLETETI